MHCGYPYGRRVYSSSHETKLLKFRLFLLQSYIEIMKEAYFSFNNAVDPDNDGLMDGLETGMKSSRARQDTDLSWNYFIPDPGESILDSPDLRGNDLERTDHCTTDFLD
ncbi:MAG: hypothetical protein U9R75_01425, partial [Candidatus Thermoplasmatota archaeon]|nr:hypothetical protein [Candidatus Thermoplasmatota archaeon]